MLNDFYLYFMTLQETFLLRNGCFFLLLVVVSTVFTYLCRRYIKIMDHPSSRSSHVGAVPRSGGIAIVLTFCVGIIIYSIFRGDRFIDQSAFWGLFISSMIIAVVSLYDDIKNRTLFYKLLSQMIGVAILIIFGLTINSWNVPYFGKILFGPYRYILTVFWIIGIINAFNFMDGLNGLAGGVAVIVAVSFSLITYNLGSGITFHLSYIVVASCLGFVFFNFPKASIFMGDVGSTFLGFTFGAMAILSSHYDQYHTSFMVIPILFSNFILETLYTCLWRIKRREPFYKAHKIHPYQLLHQMGIPVKTVTLIYYGQTLLLVGLCVVYLRVSIPVRTMLLLAIVGLYTIYFLKVHEIARKKGIIKPAKRAGKLSW